MLLSIIANAVSPSPGPAVVYPPVNPWTVIGPLAGALVVALIGAASIQVSNWIQHNRARKERLSEVRRDRYFAGLEAAEEMRDAFGVFALNISGRRDASDAPSDAESLESEKRDRRSARALSRVQKQIRNLRKSAVLVEAVGSYGVSYAMQALIELVDKYTDEVKANSPVFKGASYSHFADRYAELFYALTLAVRADLAVDELFVGSSNRKS